MDSHDPDHRLLAAFLAGDLDPAAARLWDEHLLECEHCWRAVREDRSGRQAAHLLREPAPAELADRVVFAVEVAANAKTAGQRQVQPGTRTRPRTRRDRWLRWPGLIGAGTLAAALALLLLPAGRASMPAAVAAVARYAQAVPAPVGGQHPQPSQQAAPVQVRRPVTITTGGQKIVLRTWRLGGTEAVVAMSSRPFPTPPGAAAGPGGGMTWTARAGNVGLYCLNGQTSELVAAPVPAAELSVLAARLPPG